MWCMIELIPNPGVGVTVVMFKAALNTTLSLKQMANIQIVRRATLKSRCLR